MTDSAERQRAFTAGDEVSRRILVAVRDAGPGEPCDPRTVVWTGSELRKVELPDGNRVIVKHLHPEGDWLSRSTRGTGRPSEVWRSGLLTALEPVVEHGTIGLVDFGDHEALVMHDLSDRLFPPDVWLEPRDVERVLVQLAAFHQYARSIDVQPLCTIIDRANMCNPEAHLGDGGRYHLSVSPAELQKSHEYLATRVGGQAGDALTSFFDDLPAFGVEVAARTSHPTLLHGDAKPENLGVHGGRLVAVDWGELTGIGPAEFEIVRFAAGSCGKHTDLHPIEVYDLYNRHASVKLDTDLLRLAALACMTSNGIGNLADIHRTEDPHERQRCKDRLALQIDDLRRLFER